MVGQGNGELAMENRELKMKSEEMILVGHHSKDEG